MPARITHKKRVRIVEMLVAGYNWQEVVKAEGVSTATVYRIKEIVEGPVTGMRSEEHSIFVFTHERMREEFQENAF